MKFTLITLFPDEIKSSITFGVLGRAIKNNIIEIDYVSLRDFSDNEYQSIDDKPYGGGPGMVMLVEPLRKAIDAAREWIEGQPIVVYLSPQGMVLNQSAVNKFAEQKSLILIAGRYEGIDERFISLEVDEEWSIGDYVLSGGELPAMVLIDALIRQKPGALGHQDSAEQDSFAKGLLDCPHYTRPEVFGGERVPPILLSGDHKKINDWRMRQALLRTQSRRPDLLDGLELNKEQQTILKESSTALTDDGKG